MTAFAVAMLACFVLAMGLHLLTLVVVLLYLIEQAPAETYDDVARRIMGRVS